MIKLSPGSQRQLKASLLSGTMMLGTVGTFVAGQFVGLNIQENRENKARDNAANVGNLDALTAKKMEALVEWERTHKFLDTSTISEYNRIAQELSAGKTYQQVAEETIDKAVATVLDETK